MGLLEILQSLLQNRTRNAVIVCLGLDNSGKTSILQCLNHKEIFDTVPTLGVDQQIIHFTGLTCKVVDVGGKEQYRRCWGDYFADCNAVIYVLDSTDKCRFPLALEELQILLQNSFLKDNPQLPFLFLANKSDLSEAVSAIKCAQILELDKGEWMKGGCAVFNHQEQLSRGRPWHVCETSAVTKVGIKEAADWLVSAVKYTREIRNRLKSD